MTGSLMPKLPEIFRITEAYNNREMGSMKKTIVAVETVADGEERGRQKRERRSVG